MKCLISN